MSLTKKMSNLQLDIYSTFVAIIGKQHRMMSSKPEKEVFDQRITCYLGEDKGVYYAPVVW